MWASHALHREDPMPNFVKLAKETLTPEELELDLRARKPAISARRRSR